ncbi:MAG TPA: hypothetical protein VFV61_05280 [Pyrinomonadaceae bacterium]|nr:hypothetical protein [Pyrinomonadaceae bacterium]
MSTEREQAHQIAQRIAQRVSASQPATTPARATQNVTAELASVRAVLSELQGKLAEIEAKFSAQPLTSGERSNPPRVPLTHSPWLAGVNASVSHPSQEKFGIEEATVSELVDFFEKEKMCSVEPGGKPCDHCAMCSSRGF